MPSRFAILAIVVFWVTTLGYVFQRDIRPRLYTSGPPPISVDLADEATQSQGTSWTVFRGSERVGKLTTKMTNIDSDDTFSFAHKYSQLRFDYGPARIFLPELTSTTHLDRGGSMKNQSLSGRLIVQTSNGKGGYSDLADAVVSVRGAVLEGMLSGECEWTSSFGSGKRPLAPVAAPSGQVLNAFQPIARIAPPWPKEGWIVREVNPLDDAVAAVLREKLGTLASTLPQPESKQLLARFMPEAQTLDTAAGSVECRVIEYRNSEVRAKTWLRASDGKVLRQEAFLAGEHLSLEREP